MDVDAADAIAETAMPPIVKGFGCRPHDGVAAHTGPASESLQRRKPRWGDVGRCRVPELSRKRTRRQP
jgi:hypothetical protein